MIETIIGAGALVFLCIALAVALVLLAMAASANVTKDEQLAAWEAWAAWEYGDKQPSDPELRSALRSYRRGV